MSQDDFNPRSMDAQLATIIAKQDAAAASAKEFRTSIMAEMAEMRAENAKQAERIGSLERFRSDLRAKVAAIAFVVGVFGALAKEWVASHFSGGGGHP